jgi:hypothetical protein
VDPGKNRPQLCTVMIDASPSYKTSYTYFLTLWIILSLHADIQWTVRRGPADHG